MILDNWREMSGKFVKVMPIDYRKALERLRQREQVKADDTVGHRRGDFRLAEDRFRNF